MDRNNTDYIDATEYKKLEDKLKVLKTVLDDNTNKVEASRKLRYADIDIEAEREAGRLQPDELYVPQHIIDTNIRREQSPYVQYITQSTRAIILADKIDLTIDYALLERDLSEKIRYEGYQLPMFANIDGFQSNGYGVMEIIYVIDKPGNIAIEAVQFGDFSFISDTKDLQLVEMVARTYYFTRTRLVKLCGDGTQTTQFNREQVDRVIARDPDNMGPQEASDCKDKSLYKIYKVMFRVGGIVQVAWCCPDSCDDWIRIPQPLFIGRRKLLPQPTPQMIGLQQMVVPQQSQVPQSADVYETAFPYILFPYLISENDTISQSKGRVFLDQDLQEAVSSLMSSTVTQARRAAGLYFSKDVSDPNDELLMQKNIFFRSGCIINSKVTQFHLDAPDPSMFSSIQMLVTANMNETSQVNFAANNRRDSRKTAKEIETSENQQQQLSTVQVVLFSIALTQLYRTMVEIIRSRVLTGVIKVNPILQQLYAREFTVKPSGDTDVLEKQKLIQQMTNAWPVVQNTPAAQIFLSDLLELMFPDRAAKYIDAFTKANQQQQSQQAQQMQQFMQMAQSMAAGIIHLSKETEMFSDMGKLHALPVVKQAAAQLEQLQKQLTNGKQ